MSGRVPGPWPQWYWDDVYSEADFQEPTFASGLYDSWIRSWYSFENSSEVVILQKAPPLLLIGTGHVSHWYTGGLNERCRYDGHRLKWHRFDSFFALRRQVADGVRTLVQLYDCLREHYCSIGTTRCWWWSLSGWWVGLDLSLLPTVSRLLRSVIKLCKLGRLDNYCTTPIHKYQTRGLVTINCASSLD